MLLSTLAVAVLQLKGASAFARSNEHNHKKFTAEDMLSTPRPQPAIASPDGKTGLSVVDQWDPETDLTSRSVYLIHLNATRQTPPTSLFNTTSAEASEFLWLDPSTIAYLNGSSLFSFSVNHPASKSSTTTTSSSKPPTPTPERLFDFPAKVDPSNLQYHRESGYIAFSGAVWSHTEDFHETDKWDEKKASVRDTAQVYDELFVRHWDTWRVPGRVQTLGLVQVNLERSKGKGAKGKRGFVNVLKGTELHSQVDPISSDSYALSSSHIAISVKTPHLNVATHTREDIYLFPLPASSSDTTSSQDEEEPRAHLPTSASAGQPKHLTPHSHGAITALRFSLDGKKLAWLEMRKDGYESDKRVVAVYDLKKGRMERWTEEWDRSPNSITWALDSDSLYLTAEHHGRILPYHLTHPNHLPTPLLFNGSTTAITPLSPSRLLISKQSLTSPSDDYILSLAEPTTEDKPDGEEDGDKLPRKLSHLTRWSEKHIGAKLDGQEGEEFWFQGALGKKVMGWAVKPRGWEEGEKKAYPLAFLIQWNPALFAAQGYFVVAINPTGSTGYGQEFTDAIQGDWGGKPFKDLLAGYHHVLETYPEIDPERTAALGASYGGYMINWINGHNEHFGFKALVCHDGVFDTVTTYFSTEEVWFPTQDFEGSPLTNRATYEKWSPVNHAIEWTTPELVIQGGKDYRLENSQGLGAFTALQVQGVPSRFVYFPDENHWVLKAHNSLRWHHEVFRWLDEWVGVGSKKAGESKTLVHQQKEQKDGSGAGAGAGFVLQQASE